MKQKLFCSTYMNGQHGTNFFFSEIPKDDLESSINLTNMSLEYGSKMGSRTGEKKATPTQESWKLDWNHDLRTVR